MSEESAFAPGSPIRGGVPVCFPWFGPHPTGGAAARVRPHGPVDSGGGPRATAQDVVLVLALTDADVPADQAAGLAAPVRRPPHGHGRRDAHAGARGDQHRATPPSPSRRRSTPTSPWATSASVTIRGLEASAYLDRLAGTGPSTADGEPLYIVGETDRVYEQPGTILVEDPVGGTHPGRSPPAARPTPSSGTPGRRRLPRWATSATTSGPRCSASRRATCSTDAVTLAPGERHTMIATISATSTRRALIAPPAARPLRGRRRARGALGVGD